jgi:hypothetical protein
VLPQSEMLLLVSAADLMANPLSDSERMHVLEYPNSMCLTCGAVGTSL